MQTDKRPLATRYGLKGGMPGGSHSPLRPWRAIAAAVLAGLLSGSPGLLSDRPLYAADAPPPAAAPLETPALFQEDPLEAPVIYARRLHQLSPAERANPATVAELQFNLVMACRRAEQYRTALEYLPGLIETHPADFNLRLVLVECLGRIHAADAELIPPLQALIQLAGEDLARQVRVVHLIEAMPAEIRPLKLAGDIIEKGLFAAEQARQWDAFWGWTRLEDERLALANDTASRLKLWEYPLRRKMPLGRMRLREARVRIFALEDADLVREEAQKFWIGEYQDPRADWPADAPASADLDRLTCFQAYLEWLAPADAAAAQTAFAKIQPLFAQLVFSCRGADRLAAFTACSAWYDKMAVYPVLQPAITVSRRELCQKIISDPKAAGPELLAAGDGLMACLRSDLEQADLKADFLSEQTFAAVMAFDRADKTGTPSGLRGLQAILYAIQISGEDPDIKRDRAPRYFMLYDFARLFADKATSLDAARAFVAFKAGKMPHWQATLEVLRLAAKHRVPAETLAQLIAEETWPVMATGEVEPLFLQLFKDFQNDPKLGLVVAERLLALNRWDAAAQVLMQLAAREPMGINYFAADVALARELLKADALADRLPAEAEAVLAAAFRIAPADSFVKNDAGLLLSKKQYARGDVAAAEATLQAWWDQSSTAQALRTAAMERVSLTLVTERNLVGAQALYAAIRKRLPGDPVSRFAVLEDILRALADGGAMEEYKALTRQELADSTLPAEVRVRLLNLRADELIVQGDWAGAQADRWSALDAARAAGLSAPNYAMPSVARRIFLSAILDQMGRDIEKFPLAATVFEAEAMRRVEPADADPVVGMHLADRFHRTGRLAEAAALRARLADERPWDLSLAGDAARSAVAAGDKAGAIRRYRVMVESRPGSPDLLFSLLYLSLETGDRDLAAAQFAGLMHLRGRVDLVAYANRLVELGRQDFLLAMIEHQQKTTGHVDEREARLVSSLHAGAGRLDQATAVLVRFATARALEGKRSSGIRLVGDLFGIIQSWKLDPAGEAAVGAALHRAEAELLLATELGGDQRTAGKSPEITAAIHELRLAQADLLLRQNKAEAALELIPDVNAADFDTLITHFQGQVQFRAQLCEKMLAKPPVGNPDFETKIHMALAMAYEHAGQRDRVLVPYKWLVDHAKPAEKKDWQAHYARLLLAQNRWQEALDLYFPLALETSSAAPAVAVWRIMRDHPEATVKIAGEAIGRDEFLLALVARTPGRANIAYHRSLRDQLINYGNYAVAETIARTVLAEGTAASRDQDRNVLLSLFERVSQPAKAVEWLDAEAQVPVHRPGLEKLIPQYLGLLKTLKRYDRPTIEASPFLQNLSAAQVWQGLVTLSAGDAEQWLKFIDLGLSADSTWDAAYFTALLRYGPVDPALLGLLETTKLDNPVADWGIFKRPVWWQEMVAEMLRARTPELAAMIYAQLAAPAPAGGGASLDSTRAALRLADCYVGLERNRDAQAVYAGLKLDEASAGQRDKGTVSASLQNTVRTAYFQFLTESMRDYAGAVKLLPSTRRPGSLAMRQTIWKEMRAAGNFRGCLKEMDTALKMELLQEMPDALRRDTIYDLLAASIDLGTPAAGAPVDAPGGGVQFRNQAFQLALEALRKTEFDLRRPPLTGNTDRSEGDQPFFQWLYILRNISRYDPAQRSDLNAMLWTLAKSEPAGANRVARGIIQTVGEIDGDAGRLTAINKLMELHAGPKDFDATRLELLRRLKRQDEVIAFLREAQAAAPAEPEPLHALAQELHDSGLPAQRAEALALWQRLIAGLDSSNSELLSAWARRLEGVEHAELALRLSRMAWRASPSVDAAQLYARILAAQGDFENAVTAELQSLFAREWRTREGDPQFRDVLLPSFGRNLIEALNYSDAYKAGLVEIDAALKHPVSPRHRAQLLSAQFELRAALGRRTDAVAGLHDLLALDFPQRAIFLQPFEQRLNELGWNNEAAQWSFTRAKTETQAADRASRLAAAAQQLENTGQMADAVVAYQLHIQAAAKDADLSDIQRRLGSLLHRLKRHPEAITALDAARAAGAMINRYNAWQTWRANYRDDSQPADSAATQAEFTAWATQMESASDRFTVLRDFRIWLEARNQLDAAADLYKKQLADPAVPSRNDLRQGYVLLLLRQKKNAEAVEQIGTGLRDGSLYAYNISSALRPLFRPMTGEQAADWIDTQFKPYDLSWDLLSQITANCINDYAVRRKATARLAELRLAVHPADRRILQQVLGELCQMGEFDRAFRLVAAVQAAQPAAAADARGGFGRRELQVWLAQQLSSHGCPDQAIRLLEPLRDQTPLRSWARAQYEQQLAELYLNSGRPEEALALWNGCRNDPAGFHTFRRAAEMRLFQYELQWTRDGAAAEKIYRAALADRPSADSTMNLLTQLIGFHRSVARHDKCSELLQARMDAAVLLVAERDELILSRAQTELDALTATSPEPGAALVDPVFQVFSRAYLRLARNIVPGARDNLFDRSRAMLVRIWTRNKSATQWRSYEPRLQALADQERPDLARISDLRLEIFRRREEREKVAEELARRFARQPENLSLRNQLVQAYVDAKMYTAAAGLLQADLAARPTDYRPAFALVDLYLAADRKEAAESAWQVALKLAPEEPADLAKLGRHYEDRRRFDWALELYRRAQIREPSLSAADNLARIGEKMEAPLESVQVYLAYFEGLFRSTDSALRPVDFSLAERVAPYARFERDFDKAVQLIETARAAAPQAAHRAMLTVALAELQAMRRRQSAALDLYRQALQGEFPGKADLVLHLLKRLPERNATPAALELARSTVTDPAFAVRYDWSQQQQIVQRYSQLAGPKQDPSEQDAAWDRLLETAPPDQFVQACQAAAQRLSEGQEPQRACDMLDRALAVEKRLPERKNLISSQVSFWEVKKNWRKAAEYGDRLCSLEASAMDGELPQSLSQNIGRWLNVPDITAAAALIRQIAATPELTANLKLGCYQRVFNILQYRPAQENLAGPLAALQGFLPLEEHWKLAVASARRTGRSNVESALAMLEKARPTLPHDQARLEALDAEVDILVMNKRNGQAANLWRDALKTWGDRLPRGRERMIDLYIQAGRYDLAMKECLDTLNGSDAEQAGRIENQIRSLGYALQNSKDPARTKQYGDVVEATLASRDPHLIAGPAAIWIDILQRQRRPHDVIEFAIRAVTVLPVEAYQRRNLLDQAFSQIYQLLHDSQYASQPRPAESRVLELYRLALLPALDSGDYQVSGSYLSEITQKMKLEPAITALITAAAAENVRQTDRPIAVAMRAGNLIHSYAPSQTPAAVAQWQAALAAGSPARTVLLRSLRDAAQSQQNYAAALEHQNGLLKLQPWDFEFRTEVAAILTQLKRTAAADQAWLEAGKLAESSEDQLFQLAEKMRSVSRLEGSIELYKKAFDLAKRRGSLSSWRRASIVGGLTHAEWDLNKRDQAFKFWGDGLARIARRDGHHAQLMGTLVELLAAAPDLAQIVADYEKNGRPSGLENGNLRDAFGQAWQRKSESASSEAERRALEERALANLSVAAEVLPQEPRIRERMIAIYSRRDDKARIVEQYREMSRNDPKNISYYEQMGYTYKSMGRLADMEKAWSMILEALPREGAGHRRLSEIYAGEKQFARAVAAAQAVVDNRPEDPASYVLLGQMQVNNAQFAEAEAVLLKVLDRGAEWKTKRYSDSEWKYPTERVLLQLYCDWVRKHLQVNDLTAADQVRERAHRQPNVVNALRKGELPRREDHLTPEELSARLNAWRFLQQNLPSPKPPTPSLAPDPAMDTGEVEG